MTPEERMNIAGKMAYYESILDSYDALEEQKEARFKESIKV